MSLYGYEKRLARCQRSIKQLRNGETALRFLTHLGALGLSIGRVTKCAAHLPVLLRAIDFDLKDMVLDREAAEKTEEEEQKRKEEMQKKNEELQTRLEKLETVIFSLLRTHR